MYFGQNLIVILNEDLSSLEYWKNCCQYRTLTGQAQTSSFCFVLLPIVQTACFLSSKSHHKSYQIFILAMCPLWFLWLEVHDQVEIRRFWVHLYVSSYFGCCDATAELVAPVRILYRIFGCECFIKSLNFKESWFGTKSEPNSPTSRVASRIFEVSDVRLDWSQGVFDIQFMCMLYNSGVTYGPIWV